MKKEVRLSARSLAPFLIFLVLYLAYTVMTFRDFSMSWDEIDSINGGQHYYDYYFKGFRACDAVTSLFASHNYIYSLVLVALTGNDAKTPIETYHLINMLLALFLYAAAYLLFLKMFRNGFLALAAPFALFLTPILTGHIPANYKDAPFAAVYCLTLMMMYWLDRWRPFFFRKVIILGVCVGLTASMRISGLTLIAVIVLFDFWKRKSGEPVFPSLGRWIARETIAVTAILIVSQVVMALTWPYLGRDYFGRIFTVLHNALNFEWVSGTFYFGKTVYAQYRLPWHYLPVWIAISTPLFFLFFAGLSFFPRYHPKEDDWVKITVSCLTVNALVWFLIRPVVYHGIRHFLFILPILSLLAARNLVLFLQPFMKRKKKTFLDKAIFVGTAISIAVFLVVFVKIHPYQYIYYNELAGGLKGGVKNFEGDYWANSTKEAVLWIREDMKNRSLETAKIAGTGHTGQLLYYFGPGMAYRQEEDDWDYLICNSRHSVLKKNEELMKVHTISRMGVPLCWVLYRGSSPESK